jgi:hypothetical protein
MKVSIAAVVMIALFVLSLVSGSAASAPQRVKRNTIAAGVWGGQHVRMDVNETGATFEFDCANATVAEPIAIDQHGQFRAKGVFHAESPGPSRESDPTENANATFTGSVEGDTLHLIISITDENESRSFTLVKGRKARLMKCR